MGGGKGKREEYSYVRLFNKHSILRDHDVFPQTNTDGGGGGGGGTEGEGEEGTGVLYFTDAPNERMQILLAWGFDRQKVDFDFRQCSCDGGSFSALRAVVVACCHEDIDSSRLFVWGLFWKVLHFSLTLKGLTSNSSRATSLSLSSLSLSPPSLSPSLFVSLSLSLSLACYVRHTTKLNVYLLVLLICLLTYSIESMHAYMAVICERALYSLFFFFNFF